MAPSGSAVLIVLLGPGQMSQSLTWPPEGVLHDRLRAVEYAFSTALRRLILVGFVA